MGVAFDLQADGWADDGTESGVVRTQLFGDLVRLPFRYGQYSSTATPGYNESAGVSGGGMGLMINLQQPAALPAVANSYLNFPFRGTVLGVLYDPYYGSGGFLRDFNVVIDGIPYICKKGYPTLWDGTTFAADSGEWAAVVGGLPDGNHLGQIMICPDLNSVNSTNIFGLLVERRAGYEAATKVGYPTAPTAVPTAPAAINTIAYSQATSPRGYRQVIYCNATAAAITVTVQLGGLTIWVAAVAAMSTTTWDTGVPIAENPSTGGAIKHSASASGLTYSVVGIN